MKLADIVDVFIAGDWGNESLSNDTPNAVFCIRGADIMSIRDHKYTDIPKRYISKRAKETKLLKVGDLVIEKSGGSPIQSTGRITYISEDLIQAKKELVCSNFSIGIRVKSRWNPLYVYYYWQYIYNLGVFFNFESKTSGIKNLQLDSALEAIAIEEIPLEIQNQIVATLSSYDHKIALNRAINHNLVAMAKQLYDYWFVQFDFPNQDGKPYKSSGGKMVWNEKLKREIPEGWEATTFVSLIKNSRNGDWGKETIIGNYTEKVYCIRGTDINGLKGEERIKLPTRFILKKNKEKYLSENEFVVEISGGSPTQSTGRIILLTRKMFERFDSNIICSNFCKSISLKEKKYIFFFLQEWERLYNNRTLFDYEGKTSGIKNFLFDDFINSYKIILPSKNIVEKFYSYSENIDNKLQESLKEIESLSKQRDELLPLLMNGQVTIG